MECPSCHSEVHDDSRFCDACGAPMPVRCSSCRAFNRIGARFCLECGASLGDGRNTANPAGVAGAPLQSAHPSAIAERRQLTVMFCDLVGSTALSSVLDPEDLRGIINEYNNCVTEVVERNNGLVAGYMGDGILAYFGYPQAREDDAERAARAGLETIKAVKSIDVKSAILEARVGIATGLVIVGDVAGAGWTQKRSVVGETPNLAARLQALAEPNTVLIADSTRRLLGSFFDYRDLGRVELKGIGRPVRAWQVLQPRFGASRFEALRGATLSRLIGRDEEIDFLLGRWTLAKQGEGQVVLVSGEAGLGKSRIAATLTERLSAEPVRILRYFCLPYHQHSALFPFVDQLSRAAGFAYEDPPTAKMDKLESLAAYAAPLDEDFAFLVDLLSLPPSERHPLPDLTPQRKKERTFEALTRQLEGLARQQPVLMVFEDAHWIDPTSRELLDLLVERLRHLSVLLVVTFRPEFQAPWIGQSRVSVLALNRLDRQDAMALILETSSGKAIPSDVVDQIVERTDGVPLFVEEMTKSILESGLLSEHADRYALDRALPSFAIPTSLHDSLTARLDRLGSVRHLAQIGAAIGREFSYVLLRTVARVSDGELRVALARLIASGLIFQHGAPPDAVYTFKHALVQDAARGSLLRSASQQLHAQIAEALERDSPELRESQPELLAQHFAEGGLIEKSVAYWSRAGQRSAARSAMTEATAQLQKGLDQLALLPDSSQRKQQELELLGALGAALRYVKGQAAPETGQVFTRARELWEQLGSPSQFLHVPFGQSRYHTYRGELDVAHRLDEDLLRLSRERNDSAGIVLGHDCSGRDLLLAGRFESARWHLEQVIALYDPVAHLSLAYQTGSQSRVVAQGYLGIASFCLGFPDRALIHSSAAVNEARTLAHPPSLAASLAQRARLLSLAGDDAALGRLASELIELASDQGFPMYRLMGTVYLGWSKFKSGGLAEGLSLLRSSSTAYQSTGTETNRSYYAALLARACDIAGHVDEALSILDDAMQIADRAGERWFEAELYRHKGELLLQKQQRHLAEENYRKALAIAEDQKARLWSLRAAMSLYRLARDQDNHSAARASLASVYRLFTEGLGTRDLVEAKTLLGEFS